MKLPKLIYRLIHKWTRHFTGIDRERRVASTVYTDENYVPIRAKRNAKNLPDNWTDTRWILKPRNWKHKSKNPKQYQPVDVEADNKKREREDFLFQLNKLKQRDGIGWMYFSTSDYNRSYYSFYKCSKHQIALDLYQEGLIIAETLTINYFTDRPPQLYILRCKAK